MALKVLLVYPNAEKELIAYGDEGAIAEPLALEYVAGAACADGHEVKLLDLRLHIDELEDTLRDFQPDVVGTTGYSMHVLRALAICATAKRICPNAYTAVGGHHATLEPTDFFEPQMDFVFKGEGTIPFREVLRRIEADEPIVDVAGCFARVDGEFVLGAAPAAFDINELPPPKRDLVPEDRPRYYIDWMKPIALLRTTVGCPYRCSFCALWRIMDGRYYKRDVQAVVEELASIPEKYVFFVDDEPFVNPTRMKALAAEIKAAGIEKEYFSYCRIDSFLRDRELMEQWRDIGLRRLFIGVETIFDHELADYNKRQKQAEIITALDVAREVGIELFCNFIIHPHYTEKEFDGVVEFIRDNRVAYPSFTVWTPIPGTDNTYDDVINLQPNGRPDWSLFDVQHPVIETKLPRAEFDRLYTNLFRVFADKYSDAENPLFQELKRLKAIAAARKVLGLL